MRKTKWALVLVAMTPACTARLGGGAGGEQRGGDAVETSPGHVGNGLLGDEWQAAPFSTTAPYSAVMRITATQYERTVLQAFDLAFSMPQVPADEPRGAAVDPLAPPLEDYSVYLSAAASLGEQLAPSLASACDFRSDTSGCVANFVAPALRELYRSPPTQSDIDEVTTLILEGTNQADDVEHGIAYGIVNLLLDPRFLYRLEKGKPGEADSVGGFPLTSHEFAARLSFSMWNAPADPPLSQLSDQDGFGAPVVSKEEIDRVLGDEQTREAIWGFARDWLRLGEDQLDPDPLQEAMLEETRRFIEYVLIDEQAPLSDLFSANYSFINAELAELYGVPAPEQDWERYEFPEGSRRMGVLTHGSFLTNNGAHEKDVAWIFRGKAIFEHLFCGVMPPPPPGAIGAEVENRLTAPSCSGCHSIMDPLGMFFDQFDEHGALVGQELTPGTVTLGSDIDGEYVDVHDFLIAAANSGTLEHCFVRQWFRHILGREPVQQDKESFDTALLALKETGSMKSMLSSLLGSRAVSTFYPQPKESVCQ